MDQEPKSSPMRIWDEAKTQAKIAAGFRGESAVRYVSRVVLEAAERDIEEFRRGGKPPKARQKKGET